MVEVKRIVLDISTNALGDVQAFYADLFDLRPLMDMGWIVTLGSGDTGPVQVTIATQGGGGAPVPDASIEVDKVDDVYERACARDCIIEYPLTDEPWGVRRFFVRDPSGKLLNVLSHNS